MRAPTTIGEALRHDGAHFARERKCFAARARCSGQPAQIGRGGRRNVLEAGPICLDVAARYQVTAAGAEVQLTHRNSRCCATLWRIAASWCRATLLDRVWGYSIAGETRTVDAHVQTLRKKLSEACPEAATYIETVRGVGYRLKA